MSERNATPSTVDLDTHGHQVNGKLFNADLRPIHPHQRTWKTKAFLMLWVAMCMNAATWTLAASLIALGMNWIQALFTIVLANLIVLIPMLLNSHAGAKHGISFPVFARASYGLRGANLPAILRGLVACGWFGIQTWLGGLALNLAFGAIFGQGWSGATPVNLGFFGQVPITTLGCYLFCLLAQLFIIRHGFESLRKFQAVVAPIVMSAAIVMLIYFLVRTKGDLGPVVTQPSHLGWGKDFWLGAFPPSLMANIAFWATLSLNMPDFTRFAHDQTAQRRGQSWGLPTTMFIVCLMAVLTTSMAAHVYGVDPGVLWNPAELVGHFGNRFAIVIGALIIVASTFQTNTAANLVCPALDFSNAFPKLISFRTGAILAMVVGTLLLPWKLLASPEAYVFVWLGFYGGVLGAVGGVMVADYWLHRRTNLHVPNLYIYRKDYHYHAGWHLNAVLATVLGGFFAVGGAYSALSPTGQPSGPFPPEGIISFLKPLYDYNWIVSFLVGMVAYWLLTMPGRKRFENVPFDTLPARQPAKEPTL